MSKKFLNDDEDDHIWADTKAPKTDLHNFSQGELKKIVRILALDFKEHFKGYHKKNKEELINLIYGNYQN